MKIRPASLLAQAGQALADLFLPRRCHLCRAFLDPDKDEDFFCLACLASLKKPEGPICLLCGQPLAHPAGQGEICKDCLAAPPAFQAGRFVATYEDPLAGAIKAFKYQRRIELAQSLGQLLASFSPDEAFPDHFDLVLPVPLHSSRLKSRGFNQAALLASYLSRLGPIKTGLLLRIKKTAPQMSLKGEERRRNVIGAFAVAEPGQVAGLKVLVVDDVWTTGATISQCALVLKQARAAGVWALTLSRVLDF